MPNYANKLVATVEVIDNLGTTGTQILPSNERQVRPLTKLPKPQQREVWQEAVATAPNGKVTAAHVQRTVDEYQQTSIIPGATSHVRFWQSSETNEWYTPPDVIRLVHVALGGFIDLDPASCEMANGSWALATTSHKQMMGCAAIGRRTAYFVTHPTGRIATIAAGRRFGPVKCTRSM